MGQPAKLTNLQPLIDVLSQYVDSNVRRLMSTTFQAQSTLKNRTDTGPQPLLGDVSAVVSLHEDQYHGNLMVIFPQNTIYSLLERTYDVRFNELNKSVRDAVGEIANVLFGMIKKNLNDHGYRFKMALPSVIVMGASHQVWAGKCSGYLLSFESECGPFIVAIDLCPNDDDESKP